MDLSRHSGNQDQPESASGSVVTSIHTESTVSLSQIKFRRALNTVPMKKMIVFEGEYQDSPVVVILEKTSISEEDVKRILDDDDDDEEPKSLLDRDFVNDIYGKYKLHPSPELNLINTTIIHPATEKHIEKYLPQKLHLISESYSDYVQITLPFVTRSQFDISWVYNILEHKQETERIVFEDPDPETGFVLLPDLKWDQRNPSTNLYLMAVIHKRGIKSLRDLTSDHLAILRNIKSRGLEVIKGESAAEKLLIMF